MREILFRGKTTDRGEWVQGCYTETLRYNNLHWIWDGKNHFTVNPDTIGQYTGLTDKNGKKIFEGDIVESPIGRKAVVSFGTYKPCSTKDSDDFECWKLTLLAKNEGETKLECGLGKHCMEYMRLIGNIHDNPELLEESGDNTSLANKNLKE